MRLRRARTLLAYWDGGQLLLSNYRTRTTVCADPVTLEVLHRLSDWQSPDQIVRHLPKYSEGSVRRALRVLKKHMLVVEQGSSDAHQDDRIAKVWAGWLPYGSFHFGTKDVIFARGATRDNLVRRYLAESRQPPIFKGYRNATQVPLPSCSNPKEEFLKVLTRRKTHREFAPTSVSIESLSHLLHYTWGVQEYFSTPYGRLPHKTSPSGGARHPGEVYVLAMNVQGLKPGLYHYNCRDHRLELIRKGKMSNKAVTYCTGQTYVKDAAALFVMTAVFPRSMWKYRFARAYRVVLLDAGHLCQTFCLLATFLGLAPFCTAALRDTAIEKDLGIDGISESVLYVAGIGVPQTDSN